MERKTRSHRTFSSWAVDHSAHWAVVHSANSGFDFIAKLCSAEHEADRLFQEEIDASLGSQELITTAQSPTPSTTPVYPQKPETAPPPRPPTPAPPSLSRKQKLKVASRARQKKKRSDAANGGRSVPKKIAERFPPDGPSTSINCISIENSAVVSTGYVALNEAHNRRKVYTLEQATGKGSELNFTLQHWNGTDPILIADKNEIVWAILAGHPNASDWPAVCQQAADALESARLRCSFSPENLEHRRGAFATLCCGISHGGGQTHPMNLKNQENNRIVLDELNEMSCFTRIANFGSSIMKCRAPKLYNYYLSTLTELHSKDPLLQRPFPGSVYCGVSYNLGPETVCYEHKDGGNLATGYCAVTPAGYFDPSKGGHLILWDCHLVIEFPPGSTILLPSAVVAHSNCSIQPGETRYSFTQYSAGALFRWVNNNHMCAVKFLKSLSPEQRKVEEEKNHNRWKYSLSLLPRVERKAGDKTGVDESSSTHNECVSVGSS